MTAKIDLRPWGWAPGSYVFKCIDCPEDLDFYKKMSRLGDKRSSRCKNHAIEARMKCLAAACGGASLCKACSVPVTELTQEPGCGAPLETIVAAALRVEVPDQWREKKLKGESSYPDYLIISAPRPARHHTLLHPSFDIIGHGTGGEDQGFTTSTGRYVDRAEGMKIAIAAGQVGSANRKSGSASSNLFSEDLW